MSLLVVLLALLIVSAVLHATRPTRPDDLPDGPWSRERLLSRYPRT